MNEEIPYILGVDAGGSKTLASIARVNPDQTARVVATGTAGAANPRATSFQHAWVEIRLAIETALHEIGIGLPQIQVACLGIAGAGRHDEQDSFERMVHEGGLRRAICCDDAELIFADAFGTEPGLVLIAGTGSIAMARDAQGIRTRVGGWGYMIGDEGSGFDLGRHALIAFAEAVDGRAPATPLVHAICETWQLSEPAGLIEKLYESETLRCDIAELTKLVVRLSQEGEQTARRICEENGQRLLQLIESLVQRQLSAGAETVELATAGSLLHPHVLGPLFQEQATLRFPQLKIVKHVEQPVSGAIEIARREWVGGVDQPG